MLIKSEQDEIQSYLADASNTAGGRAERVLFPESAEEVARALAGERIAVWHGNYSALELSTLLGLEPDGAIRAGIVHYNDESDVDRLVEALARLAG
jgi:selenocysteine lyase/cysteine desulfurase